MLAGARPGRLSRDGLRPAAPCVQGPGRLEYPYSGAPPPPGATIGNMLWSDPEDEPPEEMRETQAMMRRAGLLLALAMVLGMFVVGLR
ncbi:Hypothetical protein SCLAV_3832 [Streptomyces clavuligerus]|uniref:Uncharacterized protein n=1 Tax=Streptomyces clavuligerus TaxID=1901 RepID=B5GSW8_STRCL|nr:hypothetical protein SSCG_02442 [Streptomyces clavuligerus]EFG08904.1 Hypothetical protein SCLAV_3832 [Streptomyces clavuligerus]